MSTSDEPRWVQFQFPEHLVKRLDAIADLSDTDRTDLLVEAIREYLEETADSETFQELVATKYYDDQVEFKTVKQLVGTETAQWLRLLKADLEDKPLELDTPATLTSTAATRLKLTPPPRSDGQLSNDRCETVRGLSNRKDIIFVLLERMCEKSTVDDTYVTDVVRRHHDRGGG